MIGIGIGLSILGKGAGGALFPGFLSNFSNNALAFSLRKLFPTATKVLTVRRENNDQLDIGFTPTGELDTATLLSFCGSGDGFVVKWWEQGILGIHASNANALEQPRIVVAGALVTDNGTPAILSDGKLLATPYFTEIPQPISQFFVTNVPNTGINIFDGQYNDAFSSIRSFFQNIQFYIGVQPAISSNQYIINDQNLVYATFRGSSHEMIVNNNAIITSTNVTNGGLSRLVIGGAGGGSYRANGKIQEVIYFRSDQSANQVAIRTEINNYYGIY